MDTEFDLQKELKELYEASSNEMKIVEVPKLIIFSIGGRGHPTTSPGFQKKIQLLQSTSVATQICNKNGVKQGFCCNAT